HEPGAVSRFARRVPPPARRARGDARERAAAARRRVDGARPLRHALRSGGCALTRPPGDGRLAPCFPARPRGARNRRPGARARVVGVRAARTGERLERHRSRRRRGRLRDRLAREGTDDRRAPRSQDRSRRRRERAGDLRLPRRLRLAAGAVARSRRGRRDPGGGHVPAPAARAVIAAAPPPARVQVVAQEFRYSLSRRTIRAGWAVIELRNAGEDAHDLVLQRLGSPRVVRWPLVQPGGVADRELTLRPGTYL